MGRGNLITLIVFAVLIVVFPVVVTSPYYLRVINFAGIFTLICIGLSLLLGYAGTDLNRTGGFLCNRGVFFRNIDGSVRVQPIGRHFGGYMHQ